MQKCDPQLLLELQHTNQPERFVELVELYASAEEIFEPVNALARWATSPITFQALDYSRRVKERGAISYYRDKTINSVTVTLGNLDRYMTGFMRDNRIQGMTLRLRVVSRAVPDESLVLFTGKCDKPGRNPGIITAKQDYGSNQPLLRRNLTVLCPLRHDFKGEACRGGVPLASKSAAYKAAMDCDGSFNACIARENTENFQGGRFIPINGTFSYTVEETKRFLLFFSRKKKRTVSAPYSSVADFTEDTFIPEAAGTIQVQGVPLMHADTGAQVRFIDGLCDGPADVFGAKINDKAYLPGIDSAHISPGLWGSQGQPQSVQFPGAGTFSGITWIEGKADGSNPADANDTSPTISAVLRVKKFLTPDATGMIITQGYTDSGPLMLRWYLINRGNVRISELDDEAFIQAAIKCNEPVIDDTGWEQLFLPQNITGNVDFKAYALAMGFGAQTVDRIALMLAQGKMPTGGYGALVAAYYQYINTSSVPQYIPPNRTIQRRYGTNFVITDGGAKLGEFINDILLTSFNGFLRYNAEGKLQVVVEGQAATTYTRTTAAVAATEIEVEDAAQWINLYDKLILIGAHLPNSEVRRVRGIRFSTFGNSITLTSVGTGALTATASGATLSGADDFHPAAAIVTLTGTPASGNKITVTVDGISVDYTAIAGDDLIAVAGYLAATINAHITLRRYIKAEWSVSGGAVIRIVSQSGFLKLDSPLSLAHVALEETIRIEAAIGGPGQSQWLKDSFDFPLGDRISSTNVVKGTFHSMLHDWASTPIEEEASAHVRQVRERVEEEINLSAVTGAHQAYRLLRIWLGKRRQCDWFTTGRIRGEGLLLDVGDVIVVSDYTLDPIGRNVPVVIEDKTIDQNLNVELVCRLYRSDIYRDNIQQLTPPILLPLKLTGATNTSTSPANIPITPVPTTSGSGGNPVDPPFGTGAGGYGTGGHTKSDTLTEI